MSQLRWKWLPSFLIKSDDTTVPEASVPTGKTNGESRSELQLEKGPASLDAWKGMQRNYPIGGETEAVRARVGEGVQPSEEAGVSGQKAQLTNLGRSQSSKDGPQHAPSPLLGRSRTSKEGLRNTEGQLSTSSWRSGSSFDSSLFTSTGPTTWLLSEAKDGQARREQSRESLDGASASGQESSPSGLPPRSRWSESHDASTASTSRPSTPVSVRNPAFGSTLPSVSRFGSTATSAGLSRDSSVMSDHSFVARRFSDIEDDAASKSVMGAESSDLVSPDAQAGDSGFASTPRARALQRMAEAATGAFLSSLDSFKVNLAREEEHAQLSMALAKRVADQANEATEEVGPASAASFQSSLTGEGLTPAEAASYRYWMNNTLSYEDRVVDGFYEVWGMSPYVWSMCTDSAEHGRMPPLDRLRDVPPSETQFEVMLVDRKADEDLAALEDKAVGVAYAVQDVCTLARELGKLVTARLGGPISNEDELAEDWRSDSWELKGIVGSIVLPLGRLRVGLCRHRALLFKVLADSMGLPCRLVRGCTYCNKEDGASALVLFEEREYVVDLLSKPGILVTPELPQVAPPHCNVRSPLQFVPFRASSSNEPATTSGENRRANTVRRLSAHAAVAESENPQAGGAGAREKRRSSSAGDKPSDEAPMGERVGGAREPSGTPKSQSRFAHENKHMPTIGEGGVSGAEGARSAQSAQPNSRREAESGGSSGEGRIRGSGRKSSRERGAMRAAAEQEKHQAELAEWEIPWEDLTLGERIGAGSYGKVFHADWQGSDVAVKVFLDQDFRDDAIMDFKAEFAIIRRLRHPNVVLFMGAVTRPPNLSIVTEFLPRGSLYRLLHRANSAQVLDEKRRMRMALDVAKGMNYLHRSNPPIVHRDLKSPNLLVDKNWTVKVCDFGLSRLKNATFLTSKSGAGTPEWMAPEVLRNEPSDEKSDIYSFGVILWELVMLEQPWAGMNPMQVVGAVGFQNRRLPLPDHIDPSVKAIVQSCWHNNPRQRPSFAELMVALKPLQKPIAASAS